MSKYTNVIGNADKADILIIGCEPTAVNSTKRIEAPFALSQVSHDKEIYITAECLVAPLLKDECWNKAEECRINLRNDYNHICIRADETIFGKEIRPLYRHYTYVRL